MMLRGDIEEAKRTRNALQRKLKEEGATHNAEKRQLQVSTALTLFPISISFPPPLLFYLSLPLFFFHLSLLTFSFFSFIYYLSSSFLYWPVPWIPHQMNASIITDSISSLVHINLFLNFSFISSLPFFFFSSFFLPLFFVPHLLSILMFLSSHVTAFQRSVRAKRTSDQTLPLSHRGRAQQQTKSKYCLWVTHSRLTYYVYCYFISYRNVYLSSRSQLSTWITFTILIETSCQNNIQRRVYFRQISIKKENSGDYLWPQQYFIA